MREKWTKMMKRLPYLGDVSDGRHPDAILRARDAGKPTGRTGGRGGQNMRLRSRRHALVGSVRGGRGEEEEMEGGGGGSDVKLSMQSC